MAFLNVLVTSLEFVFAIWIWFLAFWLRPLSMDVEDSASSSQGHGIIRASESAMSSDTLIIAPSDSSGSFFAPYTDSPTSLTSTGTPQLSAASSPDLEHSPFEHIRHERNGRTCNIFSPPSSRKQYPTSMSYADLSQTSSNALDTPDMSMLTTEAPPPLIFAFDDDNDSLDLETGLGIRLGDAASRNSSFFLGSSASIFSKLSVDLLSPTKSKPATPSPSPARTNVTVAVTPWSPTPAPRNTLPLFTRDIVEGLSAEPRDLISFGVEAASYAATYSGSPEADIRLAAFYLYDFSPYASSVVAEFDSPLARAQGSSASPFGPTSTRMPFPVNLQLMDTPDAHARPQTSPCIMRRAEPSRLRPLLLPKELAIRQAAQAAPFREIYAPRPLLLAQHAVRYYPDSKAVLRVDSTGYSVPSSARTSPQAYSLTQDEQPLEVEAAVLPEPVLEC